MPNRLEHASCETCIFYAEINYSQYDFRRECRRNPPTSHLMAAKGDIRPYYPRVNEDDWCGEFESKQ